MSWRSIAEQYYARIAELEAQVAHFQTEYQDEIGRTELIENVARLKAALAEVDEIRDTVVFIHEREALARQEEREACKAEIARLREALDGALAADWSSLRETLARQEEREACAELFKAKIAELEAEVARQATEIEFLNDVGDERHAEKVKLEAERDRLLIDHAINLMSWQAERDRAQADAIAMTSWANALAAERDRLKAAPPIDFRCACQIAGEITGECLEQRRCQMRGQPR
jgi:hypothetical protein